MDMEWTTGKKHISVHWFRHGLRLHDNPALRAASKNCKELYGIFIFDGKTAGTSLIGYNRMRFLLESLADLCDQLCQRGGRLYMFQGDPVTIFNQLHQKLGVTKITFEQDCEPIWQDRDNAIKLFCQRSGIKCVEEVSHTLWDPKLIIKTNGGIPPLTYQMFLHTVSVIGLPPRPCPDIDFSEFEFGLLSPEICIELGVLDNVPNPEFFGLREECNDQLVRWIGGERNALNHLKARVAVEEEAFRQGIYLTNQTRPDLLAPPTSQSAALRHGCLSVRRFYWTLHDLFASIHPGFKMPLHQTITGQLIWREYFYTMSVDNPHYSEMSPNPICLNINWFGPSNPCYFERVEAWKQGKTGYPFIDAIMRQLKQEGWINHMARNAAACFLTRGDLWISWEVGVQHFLKYLLDADWSVCAGNWMWVSSSAFEQLLDCSLCVCPVSFGRRFDPHGIYVKRYVPELENLPVQYLYEPWTAPEDVQKAAHCIIGVDYPHRIVDHEKESAINRKRMEDIRRILVSSVPHCCPSNTDEVRQFMWLQDVKHEHICVS